MAFLWSIHRVGLDNLHPNFIARFERLRSPKNVLPGRTDETANPQENFVPAVAYDMIEHRVQHAIITDSRNTETLAVNENLKCTHRGFTRPAHFRTVLLF